MVTSEPSWTTRAVEPRDAEQWIALYSAYRAFYRLADDPDAVATTWGWVSGREHGLLGLVAVDGSGRLGALANLRTFARPSAAGFGLYLDDLYTDPAARRNGLGGQLLEAAAELAAARGASLVRWITADGNATARSVYDAHAAVTPWVTYDMAPRPASDAVAGPATAPCATATAPSPTGSTPSPTGTPASPTGTPASPTGTPASSTGTAQSPTVSSVR